MRAGLLRHRIIIQTPTEARGAAGSIIPSWGTFATVWASIEPTNGSEKFSKMLLQAETNHIITIRYLAGITPKMRVVFGSRIFEIVSPPINFQERNRELRLQCKELV